ncbi:MAG: hypothetical protein QG644_341 [Patescibacteria group bacterium]|nr:hypothetical protein [Patescibacteria group bacterium]
METLFNIVIAELSALLNERENKKEIKISLKENGLLKTTISLNHKDEIVVHHGPPVVREETDFL